MDKNISSNNKKTGKRIAVISISVILALAIILGLLVLIPKLVKDENSDPVMSYEDISIPTYFYELMLSRVKASIARDRGSEDLYAYLNSKMPNSDMTYGEFYEKSTLDTCKYYLAALYLFNENKLELPSSYEEEVDQFISDCIDIDYIANGSEEKFDEILSAYGVNAKTYKKSYLLNAKYEYLFSYLYGSDGSKIADSVKQEYANEHYIRFYQILVPSYYYEYETDENGDLMYFDKESGDTLYDTENGKHKLLDNGNYKRDKYGIKIMYDNDGNILYDKENGVIKTVDDTVHYYDEDKLLEQKSKAEEIKASLKDGNFSAFEAKLEEATPYILGVDRNVSDLYVSDIDASGYTGEYSYMNDVYECVKELAFGEIGMVETKYGYHIVMRYELEDGVFSDGDKSVWFENMNASLMAHLFNIKCESIVDNIIIDEENLKNAKSIFDVAINYDYWK